MKESVEMKEFHQPIETEIEEGLLELRNEEERYRQSVSQLDDQKRQRKVLDKIERISEAIAGIERNDFSLALEIYESAFIKTREVIEREERDLEDNFYSFLEDKEERERIISNIKEVVVSLSLKLKDLDKCIRYMKSRATLH
ncbi:MAG: hypothetical protein AAB367_03065 [Patescibacteria group bacterium]